MGRAHYNTSIIQPIQTITTFSNLYVSLQTKEKQFDDALAKPYSCFKSSLFEPKLHSISYDHESVK